MIQQNNADKYIPQLDTLRTLAVLLVIVSHWISSSNILNILPNGMMGVNLFFVLSGFLITGIILRAKIKAEEKQQRKRTIIINFFVRRSLRIFPIYFIVITVLLIAGFGLVKTHPIYFYTYTHNFLYYQLNTWPGNISHLWSLAVEEQFYLIWPFTLLFVKSKNILKLMTFIIFFGLIFHLLFNILAPNSRLNSVLLPTSFYAFGFGGLLAYTNIFKPNFFKPTYWKIILVISISIFLLSSFSFINFYKQVIERFLFSIISMFIIYYTTNMSGFLLRIFTNKITVYLGKISYGLYLFHPFMDYFYNKIHIFFKQHDIKIPFTEITFFPNIEYPYIRMFFIFLLLVALSSISWYVIEKPLNNLKRFFKYNKNGE